MSVEVLQRWFRIHLRKGILDKSNANTRFLSEALDKEQDRMRILSAMFARRNCLAVGDRDSDHEYEDLQQQKVVYILTFIVNKCVCKNELEGIDPTKWKLPNFQNVEELKYAFGFSD